MTTTTSTTSTTSATLSQADMAANYGWALSFLKSNKELWKLFQAAVKGNYSTARFVAALRDTSWFKKTSDTVRQNQVLQKTDPATYAQRLAQEQIKVSQLAGQDGAFLSQSMIHQIAANSLAYSWDDTELNGIMAEHLKVVKGGDLYGGLAGSSQQELNAYAQSMGVNVSDPTMAKWLSGIVGQTATIDNYKSWIEDQAVNSFPSLAKLIKGGSTVASIADPYIQQMASTLELDPSKLTVFTPQIKQALQGQQDKTGNITSVPLWQFEQQIKSDPSLGWTKTNNGRDSLMTSAQNVLKDFGFHY